MNDSERLGIIITLSIAMLGSATVVMYSAIHVEAAGPTWCYDVGGGHSKCIADSTKKSDCIAASLTDTAAVNPGKCFDENKVN